MLKVLFEVDVGIMSGYFSIFTYELRFVVFLIAVELFLLLLSIASVTYVRMI